MRHAAGVGTYDAHLGTETEAPAREREPRAGLMDVAKR